MQELCQLKLQAAPVFISGARPPSLLPRMSKECQSLAAVTSIFSTNFLGMLARSLLRAHAVFLRNLFQKNLKIVVDGIRASL